MGAAEVGWRQVLALGAAIVVGVLALQVLSSLVPPIGAALASFPTIIVLLVVVTAGMLFLTLRAQRPRR